MSSGSTREETPEPVIPKPVYGFLKVVPRKGGGVQDDKVEKGFPIHGEMITFGRDPDSSIKVIHESISRRHVELTVDPLDYKVTTKILGRSGATYRTARGARSKLPAGSSQILQSGDTITIHKTCFSYTSVDPEAYLAESLASIGTPQAQRAVVSTPLTTSRSLAAPSPRASASVQTPAVAPVASPMRVPAKIALSTPKGRMSLLKHTVLQSARKQWIAQKPTGLEGAVEDGKIEVMRRKSTSPSKAVVELSEDESDDERVEEEEEQMNRHAIPSYMAQPARKDGEEDEEEEEQAAAHKGDVEMQHGGSQQEYEQELAEEAGADVSLDLDEYGEEMQETANGAMHLDQSGTEDQGQYAQEMQEEDDYYEDEDMEGDFDEAALQPAAPATPQAPRPLSAFYTPQVRNTNKQDNRRSLAGIGAPAWRPAQFNTPINPLASPAFRPGGRQMQVKMETKAEYTPQVEEGEEDDGMLSTPVRVKQDKVVMSAAQLAEMKKRRQSLGTPRALPAAPASFSTPASSFSFTKPLHPALRPSLPTAVSASTPPRAGRTLAQKEYEEEDDMAAPPTPLQSIRKQLDSLRLQAEERSSRRLSTGTGTGRSSGVTSFASAPVLSFVTPARTSTQRSRSHFNMSAKVELANRPQDTPMPLAPMLEAEEGDSSVSSINLSALATPTRTSGANVQLGSSDVASGTPFRQVRADGSPAGPVSSSDRATPRRMGPPSRAITPLPASTASPINLQAAPASPARTPAKSAPRKSTTPTRPPPSTASASAQMQTQTPDYTGLKHMMPSHPAAASTPNMAGLRRMLDTRASQSGQAPASPATPQYGGVRQLYPALPTVAATPDMRHMGVMFASPAQYRDARATAFTEAAERDAEGGERPREEPEIIVSPVKNWQAASGVDGEVEVDAQVDESGLDEQGAEDEEVMNDMDERYAAETDAEGLGENDSSEEEEEEEEEEVEQIEYRSPVPRRCTRSSPVKMSSPSEVSRKLLQSTAVLSAPSRHTTAASASAADATAGPASQRSTRQTTKSPVKPVGEEQTSASRVLSTRSTRGTSAAPARDIVDVRGSSEEEEEDGEEEEQLEEQELESVELLQPTRAKPAAPAAASRSAKARASGAASQTAGRRPTARSARLASTSTNAGSVKTESDAEPELEIRSAPARSTRKKAGAVSASVSALEETGVQGVVDEKPSVRSTLSATATKARATRTIKPTAAASKTKGKAKATGAVSEKEEQADGVETKSAPVRRTRTAAAATSASTTTAKGKAPAKDLGKSEKASAPTRATRSTRGKTAATAVEEKENVAEAPSRSTRSRR